MKSGMEKGLNAADGVIDYLLPGEETQQEHGAEEGVWGHGKEVTSKAKGRLTSLVANKYYQTGDYISTVSNLLTFIENKHELSNGLN